MAIYTIAKIITRASRKHWRNSPTKVHEQNKEMQRNFKLLGIGIGFIVEIGTPNFAHFGLVSNQPPSSLLSNNTETANVRMEPTRKVRVTSGMAPQGQGHETAISQVVADDLGIPVEDVMVASGFDSASILIQDLRGLMEADSGESGLVLSALPLES